MLVLLSRHITQPQQQQLQHLHAVAWAAWASLLQAVNAPHCTTFSAAAVTADAPLQPCHSGNRHSDRLVYISSSARQLQAGCDTPGQPCHNQQQQHLQWPQQRNFTHLTHYQHSSPLQQQQLAFPQAAWPSRNLRSYLTAWSSATLQESATLQQSATLQDAATLQQLAGLQDAATLQGYVRAAAPPFQLQQQRHYHAAQHKARLLTVQIQQQKHWQDLQLLYDSCNGGRSLNIINLTTMLLQLSRVAPKLEFAPANERQKLKQFTLELVACCHRQLHRMDHRGLGSFCQSLATVGYDVHQPIKAQAGPATPPAAAEEGDLQAGGNSSRSLFADILTAVVQQLPRANAVSCGVLCTSLSVLLQQQQDQAWQQQQQDPVWQQQQLLQDFLQTLAGRIQSLTEAGRLTVEEACKLCFAIGKLTTAVRAMPAAAPHETSSVWAASAAEAAAAIAAATEAMPSADPAMPATAEGNAKSAGVNADSTARSAVDGARSAAGGATSAAGGATSAVGGARSAASPADLARELRSLLTLTAQQVATAVTAAGDRRTRQDAEPPVSPGDVSQLLFALAKSWAWPGWDTVLPLLQQYSLGMDICASDLADAAPSSSSRHKHRRPAAAAADSTASRDMVIKSLPSMTWAIGRLLELQQQRWPQRLQHSEHLLQQLQQYTGLWASLESSWAVGSHVIGDLNPIQLAQLAAGVSMVMGKSWILLNRCKSLVTAGSDKQQVAPRQDAAVVGMPDAAATAAEPSLVSSDHTDAGTVAEIKQAAETLEKHLNSASLQALLQQHVARVEQLLPIMPVETRLQLADSYKQLHVRLARNVELVFQRDAEAAAKQTQYWQV